MNNINSKAMPAPPNIIHIILAGFDSITNHLILILFPMLLDLLLWFGPRLSIKNLVKSMLNTMAKMPGANSPEMIKLMEINQTI